MYLTVHPTRLTLDKLVADDAPDLILHDPTWYLIAERDWCSSDPRQGENMRLFPIQNELEVQP